MANSCYFLMRISGREEDVHTFIRMLQQKEPYLQNGFGHVRSFEMDEDSAAYSPHDPQYYSVEGQGDCDHSLKVALQDFPLRPLQKETERLGLVVEAYSSEPACEFQEHILLDRGTLLIEDCVHYEEYFVEDMDDAQLAQLSADKGLTREQLLSKVNHNGEYCEGGFETFGAFHDPFPYLSSTKMQYTANWGETYTVYPYMGKYDENNNLFFALACFDKDAKDVVPFSDITINAGKLPYLHSAIAPFIIEEEIKTFLLDNGFGAFTGEEIQCGFSSYPVFHFHEEKLREVCPVEFAEYAKAHGRSVQRQKPSLTSQIRNAERTTDPSAREQKPPKPEPER